MSALEIPRLAFEAREIHSGNFPLWDPHLWNGQPLIGQTQPGPLYPANLLLAVMPMQSNGTLRFSVLNWYYVLIHFQAALFCFLLCRDLSLARLASALAGCAFAFAGMMGTVPWIDVMNGVVWTPLVFLFFLRVIRRRAPLASAALCGASLGTAWLSGHHEIPLLLSFTIVCFWLYALITGREGWRSWALLPVCLLCAGLVASAQFIPTLEFGRNSKRWVGTDEPVGLSETVPYTVHTQYSLAPRGVLETVLPVADDVAGSTPFMGVGIIALAALGLMANWEQRWTRWMAALAALAMIYAMGAFTPLHGILYSVVPALGKARTPVRAIYLFNFGVAVLGGFGVQALLDRSIAGVSRYVAWACLVFAVVILGASVVAAVTHQGALPDRTTLAAVAALCLAGTLAAWQRAHISKAVLTAALFVLCFAEWTGATMDRIVSRSDPKRNLFVNALTQDDDIAAFLRAQGPTVRIAFNNKQTDVLADFGDLHGIDMLQGFVAGTTRNILLHELHTERTRKLFGVTHYIGHASYAPDEPEVFAGRSGLKVFRVPDPMPRTWAVHQLVAVNGQDELRRLVQDPAFDFHSSAALFGTRPGLEQCSGDAVQVVSHGSDSVSIKASMNCRGMVVLSDTSYPGWKAWVDGQQARIYEPYGVFRGVVLERGAHTVEFAYRPLSVYVGALLTILGFLTVGLLALVSRRSTAFAGQEDFPYLSSRAR